LGVTWTNITNVSNGYGMPAIAVLFFLNNDWDVVIEMAGTITALQTQKRSRDRVNVYLDGEYAFGLAVFTAVHLKVGVWLSDEEITRLREADEVERTRSRVLDYLSYRPRSEWEIREYLKKRGISISTVETVVNALIEVNLIDDNAFAKYWLENRAQYRPKGKRILSRELQQKGVSSKLIDEILVGYDEETAARRVFAEQARRLKNLSPDVFRRRILERMARRGFNYDLIQDLLSDQDLSQSLYMKNEED
jgi:regulatory protein